MTRQELVEELRAKLRANGLHRMGIDPELKDRINEALQKSAEWIENVCKTPCAPKTYIEYVTQFILFRVSIQIKHEKVTVFSDKVGEYWDELESGGVSEADMLGFNQSITHILREPSEESIFMPVPEKTEDEGG